MSNFLDEFGRELDLAVARRIAGERPARPVLPAVVMVLAVAAVLAGSVLALSDQRTGERPATPATAPPVPGSLQDVPAPPAGLADTPVVVANGTGISGLAARYAQELRNAGWSVGAVTNAAHQNVEESFATGPGADQLAQAFGLETGAIPLGSEDGELALVLGADAAPKSEPYYWDARAGDELGSACLVLRNVDELPLSSCGVATSGSAPLGLVTVATLPNGDWLVYGYASDQTRSVRVGRGEPFKTELKRGVPGRFFHSAVPPQPSVYVAALDAAGNELGTVGTLTPSAEKAGDLAGFAPTKP